MQPDPILIVDELLKMDDRLSSIKHKDDLGRLRNLELKDFQKAVCDVQLIPTVPDAVKTSFKGAKQLYIFGYFEYYFLSISLHYLFLSVESALRNKHIEIFGKLKHFLGFNKIIKDLVGRGVIRGEDKSVYMTLPNLRNEMSHLTQPTVLPVPYKMFERIAEMINQLYDE